MKNKFSVVSQVMIALILYFCMNNGWAFQITGTVFSGQVKSSKSTSTWPAVLKFVSYDPSSGRLQGELEWPDLNSVHKIAGQLTGSRLTFREVDYIKKGRANLNCEYNASIENGVITGNWTDPNGDHGTFQLSKQTVSSGTGKSNSIFGSVFPGRAISAKSQRSWSTVLKFVSYDPASGRIEGELEWTSLNSIHKIVGQLTDSRLTFKEVDYIKQGSANLNCEYNASFENGVITGNWSDPSGDHGTFQLKKE